MLQLCAAAHKLQLLQRMLSAGPRNISAVAARALLHTDGQRVTIGGVTKEIREPSNPELVPKGYLGSSLSQWEMRQLRWLLQKDNMGQDVFLIGGPGPLRRHLALSYLELTKQEAEFVTLTRDTTESDLKQRREILDSTSYYHDQSAVRAALHGRVLVLDGIEKAERNVLPVLNNLLENREMNLDDGRRLIPHTRYDRLYEEHGEGISSLQVLRVSPHFRVIALGLPCPPHQGQPLDPPLRSRFQAREIMHPPFQDQLQQLISLYPNVSRDVITRCLSVAHAILAKESKALGLPDYPLHLLEKSLQILNMFPTTTPESILPLVYPHKLCLTQEAQTPVDDVLQTFDLAPLPLQEQELQQQVSSGGWARREDGVAGCRRVAGVEGVEVTLNIGGGLTTTQMLGGPLEPSTTTTTSITSASKFVPIPYHRSVLASLLTLHATGSDVCIVGPRGCGKTEVVEEMARVLGYQVETILMYQDMTARELSQQRATDAAGNTVWRASPLLLAAKHGRLAVLDGLHRLHGNTLASLQRLIQDREVQLHDGSRLIDHHRFAAIQADHGYTDQQMAERGIGRIHPAFRIVALAEPPQLATSQGQWMKPEALSLMPWQQMRQHSTSETIDLLNHLVRPDQESSALLQRLVGLSQEISTTTTGSLASLSQSLSFRQLLRIARRIKQYPDNLSLYELVQDACLARFLPILVKQALDETMAKYGIEPPPPITTSTSAPELRCTVDGDTVTIGNTSTLRYKPESDSKVPKTLFFDIQQHVQVLQSLLQDWLLGQHLLLIGNQGVGKNKLADRFLDLLNRPREYLQLHRDSTVQSLTVQPCVKAGLLSYEDSPLVTAVKTGAVLLLDEADKAPTHVTCVLKTLVERGEMLLSDGRRIVPASHPLATATGADVIVAHKDFRMIVLANRPGFPFLGNDFFAVLGDLFACHAIHNPLAASELALLRSYAPAVPQPLLAKLVAGFGELRDLADEGKLQYPYSTREVVAVVKHLQHYPKDGVAVAIRNVFDFDSWSSDAKEVVVRTLHKHGVPVDVEDHSPGGGLATKVSLGAPVHCGSWRVSPSEARPLTRHTEPITYKGPTYVPFDKQDLNPNEARASIFTELHSYYSLSLSDTALITDIMTSSTTTTVDSSTDDDTINVHNGVDKGNSNTKTNSKTKSFTSASGSRIEIKMNALRNPLDNSKAQDTIHVASVAPLSLHTLLPSDSLIRPVVSLSLHSIFPKLGGSHQPRLRLWSGGTSGMVGLYEELTNTVLLADPHTGEVLQLNKNTFMEKIKMPLRQLMQQDIKNCCAASGNSLMIYTSGENSATIIDPESGKIENLKFPFNIKDCVSDSRNGWIVTDEQLSQWLLGGENGLDQVIPLHLDDIGSNDIKIATTVNDKVIRAALNKRTTINSVLGSGVDGGDGNNNKLVKDLDGTDSGLMFATKTTHAVLLPGFPHESSGSLYSWPRDGELDDGNRRQRSQYDSISFTRAIQPVGDSGRNCVALQGSGQVIQSIRSLPSNAPDILKTVPASGYLEVTDVANRCVSYLPVPPATEKSEYWQWSVGRIAPNMMLAGGNGGVASVDRAGGVRVWEVGGEALKSGMAEWVSMVGDGESERLEIERVGGSTSLAQPKHGKLDSKNDPHVGGNTWAGGTGGRDTAGLGGVGGPYRLDAGHDVHQVSDEVKQAVPPEITAAARKMAQAAFKRRLKEIEMSEYDAEQYENVRKNVSTQVTQMRAVLSSLTAKAGERYWIKRRPDGELDDNALVDGLAGATNIYRQRQEVPPEAGQPQVKPKRLRLLLDASGSMYRFNGHDNRLQRSLEAALMLMEACLGHESRLIYDIHAHSGEDFSVPLATIGNVPDDNKKRLDLLRTVLAHSQFCMAGDNTVAATKFAVDELAKTSEECDQSFVVLLSDANLDRYGISPARLANAMTAQKSVQCYAVFIGSLGNQAKRLAEALPAGRAYVCLDVNELPQIMQHIFTHAMTQ